MDLVWAHCLRSTDPCLSCYPIPSTPAPTLIPTLIPSPQTTSILIPVQPSPEQKQMSHARESFLSYLLFVTAVLCFYGHYAVTLPSAITPSLEILTVYSCALTCVYACVCVTKLALPSPTPCVPCEYGGYEVPRLSCVRPISLNVLWEGQWA